jgi:hypothetical protein
VVVVPVGGQDTKCGTFQAEACALEEYLEELIGTPGVKTAPVEGVAPALR